MITKLRGPAAAGLMLLAAFTPLVAGPAAMEEETGSAVNDTTAQMEEPEPGAIGLSLSDAIDMALEGNLDIRVAKINPELGRQDEIAARGFFDPVAFADFSRSKQNQEPTNFLGTSSSQFDNYVTGVSEEFITGGSASLNFNNSRSDLQALFPINFNPSYSSSLTFRFNQPLLRGFGRKVATSRIVIARNNVESSEYDFRNTVMQTVREATDGYWNLAAAIAARRVARESLGLANQLLDLNRAKVEVGTLAPIEITQAEAGVASRQEAVIVSENAVRTAEDALRRVLNVPKSSNLWINPINPTDKPEFQVVEPQIEEEVATALANRPDLEQERIRLRNLELQAAVDRNGVLPQLDLYGTYGLSGTAGDQRFQKLDQDGDGIPDCDTRDPACSGVPVDRNGDGKADVVFVPQSISDAWDQVFNADLVSWSAGLTFSIPIGNRPARAQATRSRLQVDQAKLVLENLERTVEIDVRNASRDVRTNVQRVQAAQSNLELQKKKLEAEQKRFQYGMTTSFQVLEFQTDLTDAEASLIRAVLDYKKSLVALAEKTGVLLEKQGIEAQ